MELTATALSGGELAPRGIEAATITGALVLTYTIMGFLIIVIVQDTPKRILIIKAPILPRRILKALVVIIIVARITVAA